MTPDAGIPPIPLFILSLPRSGSTLLQRMMSAHPAISTSPEPTFLLPLFNLDRRTDVVATYDQRYTAWAVEDFVATFPHGREDYRRAIADFALRLYGLVADPQARYHIDKTPKYHLVAEDVMAVFPGSPIIVLWRNPLAIISSIMTTWGRSGGRWNLADFRIDLFEGLPRLVSVAQSHPDRVIPVRYEDLVFDPESTVSQICNRLDVDFSPSMVDQFSQVVLHGRVQDPHAQRSDFQDVRTDRVEQWRTVLANPVRRRWVSRYLRWLGAERLELIGYSLDGLLEELEGLPFSSKYLATDLLDIPLDHISRALELPLVRKKLRDVASGRPLLAHK